MKAALAAVGVLCLLAVASMSFPVAAALPPPLYPPCTKVASYSLMGQQINLNKGDQSLSTKSYSFVRHSWGLEWSSSSLSEIREFLDRSTKFTLTIDGKPVTLRMDICYDRDGAVYGYADTVWKVYYVQFTPHQWKGPHKFVGTWFDFGTVFQTRTAWVLFTLW